MRNLLFALIFLPALSWAHVDQFGNDPHGEYYSADYIYCGAPPYAYYCPPGAGGAPYTTNSVRAIKTAAQQFFEGRFPYLYEDYTYVVHVVDKTQPQGGYVYHVEQVRESQCPTVACSIGWKDHEFHTGPRQPFLYGIEFEGTMGDAGPTVGCTINPSQDPDPGDDPDEPGFVN